MNREERNDLYKSAVEKWGEEAQLDQLIEEMAELMLAINKYKRMKKWIAQKKEGVLENLFEEIADVKLCIEQMEWIFGEDVIDKAMQEKVVKFKKQLDE